MSKASRTAGQLLHQAYRRSVPSSLRRLAWSVRSDLRLLRLERALKARYGRAFVSAIYPRDEIFLFVYLNLTTGQGDAAAAAYYLQSGERTLGDLAEILRGVGRDFQQLDSFLEFACGYGRVTRFLVRRMPPERLTVSDIDHAAVDWVRKTFGVTGFYSVADPRDLHHDRQYDVVFVASLFSHLPRSLWLPWLLRLRSLLEKDGLLVFSTLNLDAYEAVGRDGREVEGGFFFRSENETLGRLPAEIYGLSYVSDIFVRRLVEDESLGPLVGFYPNKLFERFQDVYVLKKE